MGTSLRASICMLAIALCLPSLSHAFPYALHTAPTFFPSPAPASLAQALQQGNACDVRAYGAVGDNSTLNTAALQKAFLSCHGAYPADALVVIPAGTYLTGSLNLTSNMTLFLAAGATLIGSQNTSDYAVVPSLPPGGTMWTALLAGYGVSNVRLTGEAGGALDGAGWPWWCSADPHPATPYDFCHAWPSWSNRTLEHQRPKLLECSGCRNLEVSNIELRNSAFWTFHPVYSSSVHVANLTVLAPRAVGNTDGIDPSSSLDVLVENCLIDVGDDGISIKSYNASGDPLRQMPTARVHMRNLTILSRNWCVGSATYGGISDLLLEDSRIGDDAGSSPWAIKFKSHRYYPGAMENILFRNLRLGNITGNAWQQPGHGHAFLIGLTYSDKPPAHRSGAPILRNVSFVDITAFHVDEPGALMGLPESPLLDVRFINVTLPTQGTWECENVGRGLVTDNLVPALKC